MAHPRYLRGKDGKFAGSRPTPAPTAAPQPAAPHPYEPISDETLDRALTAFAAHQAAALAADQNTSTPAAEPASTAGATWDGLVVMRDSAVEALRHLEDYAERAKAYRLDEQARQWRRMQRDAEQAGHPELADFWGALAEAHEDAIAVESEAMMLRDYADTDEDDLEVPGMDFDMVHQDVRDAYETLARRVLLDLDPQMDGDAAAAMIALDRPFPTRR